MSQIIDLYGGSVEVYFITKNQQRLSLSNIFYGESLSNTPFSGTTFNPQSAHFIQSVSVKNTILGFTNIEVTFTPPFDEAISLINSGVIGLGFSTKQPSGEAEQGDPQLATNMLDTIGLNQICVRMHYGGMSSPFYKGYLMPPEIDIGTDGIVIRVRGVGLLFKHTKTHKNKVIKNLSKLQIIQSLIGDDEDLNVFVNDSDSTAQDALSEIHSLAAVDSNWIHIKTILDQCNCALFDTGSTDIDGSPTFEIVSKEYLRTRKDAVFKFVLWQNINPNLRIFPILDLRTNIANYEMGQSTGLNNQVLDSKTKVVDEVGRLDFTKVVSTTDGSIGGSPSQSDDPDADTGITPEAKKVHAPADRENAPSMKNNALALLQKALDKALQYEITTVGIMELLPGRAVQVDVGGVAFLSGIYDLYTVTHEFSTDGVTTKLNVSRTFGLAGFISRGVQPALEKLGDTTDIGSISQVAQSNGVF